MEKSLLHSALRRFDEKAREREREREKKRERVNTQILEK
jgi:hypothetical protein